MSFEDSKLEATPNREKDTTASAKVIPLCQSRMKFSHLDGVQFLNSVSPGLQQCSTGCLARGAEAAELAGMNLIGVTESFPNHLPCFSSPSRSLSMGLSNL